MPPLKSTGPLRILVVEDNFINQRLMMAFLEEAGYAHCLAATGREALAVLEREGFDLVLMDIEMPDMDGFQATAAIRVREEATGDRLPILAMTAHATLEDRDRCLAAGMDGYVSKPIRYEELIELIEGSVCPERVLGPEARPSGAEIGRAGVRKELAGLFVDDATRLHAEIREAITRRDGPALQRAAHSLCGTAGFFLAELVHALAQRLESLGKEEDFSAETDRASRELADELARLARPAAEIS